MDNPRIAAVWRCQCGGEGVSAALPDLKEGPRRPHQSPPPRSRQPPPRTPPGGANVLSRQPRSAGRQQLHSQDAGFGLRSRTERSMIKALPARSGGALIFSRLTGTSREHGPRRLGSSAIIHVPASRHADTVVLVQVRRQRLLRFGNGRLRVRIPSSTSGRRSSIGRAPCTAADLELWMHEGPLPFANWRSAGVFCCAPPSSPQRPPPSHHHPSRRPHMESSASTICGESPIGARGPSGEPAAPYYRTERPATSWRGCSRCPERCDAFEADVRRLLKEASPSGRFSERQPSTEVFVWRKGLAEA